MNQEKISSIKFHYTNNIFVNAGIVGLYEYLDFCSEEEGFPDYVYKWEDNGKSLLVQSEQLFSLLEQVYYYMGRELYDTSGKKAREKVGKYYFTQNPFSATPFCKMKSYGLAALITNDPAPFPKYPNNSAKFATLVKEDEDFAKDIAKFYASKDLKIKDYHVTSDGFEYKKGEKGDSKIFLNEPYIKITRLDPLQQAYLLPGEQFCYLTGERYKKLIGYQNISPFLGGMNNFDSFASPANQKVGWKAMYVMRFAPKVALYTYTGGLEGLICFLYDSDSLEHLHQLFSRQRTFYADKAQLIENSYYSNFKVHNFYSASKGGNALESPKDYVHRQEVQFMLLYTIYRQLLFEKGLDNTNSLPVWLDLTDDDIPIRLAGLRADKFSSTLRPSQFEYFNNLKFAISLFTYLEKQKVNFAQIMPSLKYLRPTAKSAANSYQMERKLRSEVLDNMINSKSIIDLIVRLFYQCFSNLITGEAIGFKNFYQLTQLVTLYEPLISTSMTKEIQEKAFNLGTSIGRAILEFEQAKDPAAQKSNAKGGRKYIVALQKARNLTQFNQVIIRLQNKYQLIVKTELFKEDLAENNFNLVKQFALIGALNQINSVLQPKKQKA